MRTKLKSFILTAALFGALHTATAQTAVDSLSKENKARLTALAGKWYLVPALPSDTSTGRLPDIDLDVQLARFSGNTGCNRMSGSFIVTDTSIHFSDKMVTTRMACIGYNETAFLQNLARVDRYEFKDGFLILTVHGVEVSRWSRKVVKAKKIETT